ncbi:MAG: MgtC/SapB family protein, partial [Deltaproteobacteria bacterium]|nr:MgtC/SapB family protein [Deltaproteobacteria bacterium]
MNDFASPTLIDGAIAIGLGVFIGLEREHSDVDPRNGGVAPSAVDPAVLDGGAAGPRPARSSVRSEHIGVRTFALVALLGWVCAILESTVRGISLVGLGVVGGLVALQYVRTWQTGAGVTTEIAGLVTFGLGLLVRQNRLLAISLAVVVTLLLISKSWVRRVVANIERRELIATLQLAIMLAVVLPLLPTEARDPWGVLAPRRLGLFVVLIAGLSFVGYVLSRRFGMRKGAGLSGLLGGLVSSTAVTAAMAERARRSPEMIVPGQMATFLANAVMFVRVMVVSAVLSRPTAIQLALPMAVMSLVMLAGAFWKWRALSQQVEPQGNTTMGLQNPFALLPALKWAMLLAVTLVFVAIAQQRFGVSGVFVVAALAGIADMDAVNIAMNRQAAAGTLNVNLAVLAITVAALASIVTKIVIVLASGGRRFG